ncbi:uncharacterized protein METZ01_LOCUS198925 [marine metagenome]|uniref:Uncharacterized protein n=1 Tax=marine metagenome TaxID=408172 RepID=A0A382E7V0_9ZZZZ
MEFIFFRKLKEPYTGFVEPSKSLKINNAFQDLRFKNWMLAQTKFLSIYLEDNFDNYITIL